MGQSTRRIAAWAHVGASVLVAIGHFAIGNVELWPITVSSVIAFLAMAIVFERGSEWGRLGLLFFASLTAMTGVGLFVVAIAEGSWPAIEVVGLFGLTALYAGIAAGLALPLAHLMTRCN